VSPFFGVSSRYHLSGSFSYSPKHCGLHHQPSPQDRSPLHQILQACQGRIHILQRGPLRLRRRVRRVVPPPRRALQVPVQLLQDAQGEAPGHPRAGILALRALDDADTWTGKAPLNKKKKDKNKKNIKKE
jgi:hypothetical protein